MVIIRG